MMRYKSFVWDPAPDTLSIQCERDVKDLRLPFCGSVLQDTGAKKLVVTGSGSFVGKNCFARFQALAGVFAQPGSALLALPETPPFPAFFTELQMTGKARANTVSYRFAFLEDGEPRQAPPVPEGYRCTGGENLWAVAARFGADAEDLLRWNLIFRPTCLESGQFLVLKAPQGGL